MTIWTASAATGPLMTLYEHSPMVAPLLMALALLPLAHKILDQRHERWILDTDRRTQRFNTKERGVALPPESGPGQPGAERDPPTSAGRRGFRRRRGQHRRRRRARR